MGADWEPIYIAIAVASFLVLIVGIIACACCCGKKGKQRKKAVRNVSVRVRQRMSGLYGGRGAEPNQYARAQQYHNQAVPVEGRDNPAATLPMTPASERRPSEALINEAVQKALASTMSSVTIDSKRLTFDVPIGRGHFGMVYKGWLTDRQLRNPEEVAIKTVIDESSGNLDDVSGFVEEALRMKSFSHPNVLSIKGLVIKEDRPFVVMPFMHNGDLRSYISDSTRVIVVLDLLKMAQQIASGMAYLVDHNFIHRDLAARNIMVDKKALCKIADFGLSRELFDDDYYKPQDPSGPMPIKWMALESLTKKIFTPQSDVWSFGIVMWELMTRGKSPYPGMKHPDVTAHVQAGHRPVKPQHCPPEIYETMRSCWHPEPKRRPEFKTLAKELAKITKLDDDEDN